MEEHKQYVGMKTLTNMGEKVTYARDSQSISVSPPGQ